MNSIEYLVLSSEMLRLVTHYSRLNTMYLNTHSYYSFKYGAISPEDLLGLAKRYDIRSLVLTDINTTAGCLKFIRLAQKDNIKPVVGIDFRNGAEQQYVAIAKNNTGFQELNDFLSCHLHNESPIPSEAPDFKNAFVIYPFQKSPKRTLLAHEYIGVRHRDLSKFPISEWNSYPQKLIALQTVTFRNKRDFNAHRLLRAIDNNTLLSKLPTAEQGHREDVFLTPHQLDKIYRHYPFLIENANSLIDQCHIDFDFSGHSVQNLKTYTGSIEKDFDLLRRLCLKGLGYRYPDYGINILRRLAPLPLPT